MIRACDLKKSSIVNIEGAPCMVDNIVVKSPSARGSATLYKVRFRNIASKQKVDKVFKGDDAIDEADFEKREVQFLYSDGSSYAFMDLDDYSQFELNAEDLEGQIGFLSDGLEEIKSLISDGKVLGIELPPVVELEITETGPSMRSASATARTKPATLATGHVIQVPEYMETGEIVKVDTRTGDFLSRA
jgi:elongation factor P